MNGFDPSALISAASGAGGVIAAALLLLGRSEKKTKDISKLVVLEHQTDCPVSAALRQENLVSRQEMLAHIEVVRGEVRTGMGGMNGRLDKIFEWLSTKGA